MSQVSWCLSKLEVSTLAAPLGEPAESESVRGASGFHFALEPEGRLDAVCGKAVEDRLDLALVGACRLGAVLEHKPQPGHHPGWAAPDCLDARAEYGQHGGGGLR